MQIYTITALAYYNYGITFGQIIFVRAILETNRNIVTLMVRGDEYMAGHSKWANIKHKKKKPMLKEDLYETGKKSRLLSVWAGRSEFNSRLKDIIAKAKANMFE